MAPIKKTKKGWLGLTTTTKRSWSKEDHVHQGQYQRKKLKEPCVEEEIIDGLEGSSLQKIIKKRPAHSNHSDQEEREQRKPSPPRLIPKKKKMDRFWM